MKEQASPPSYKRHRFPSAIISHVVSHLVIGWLTHIDPATGTLMAYR